VPTFNEDLDEFDRQYNEQLNKQQVTRAEQKTIEAQFVADADVHLKTVGYPVVEATANELNAKGHTATARCKPHARSGRLVLEFTFVPKGSTASPVSWKVEVVEHMLTLSSEEHTKIRGGHQSSPTKHYSIAELTPDAIRHRLLAVVRSTLN
jgi:hypothetical protein